MRAQNVEKTIQISVDVMNPVKVWRDDFMAPRIGKDYVHSDISGNRFQGKGERITIKSIEAALGTIIAQGESFNDSEFRPYHKVCFWTEDWVAVVDDNHGWESLYCLPRNPKEVIPLPSKSLRAKVFLARFARGRSGGDFVATGCGGWNSAYVGELVAEDSTRNIFWSEKYVYAEEIEYEGEYIILRTFPRNP